LETRRNPDIAVKKRILLAFVKNPLDTYQKCVAGIQSLTRKEGGFLSSSLGTIAALTPRDFQVTLADENVQPLPFGERFDIVGISAYPTQFDRVREVLAAFRRRGALGVLGGPAVSLNPDRWRDMADVLILGEAERTWPRFLKDYLAGSHHPEYREIEFLDMSAAPMPDYRGLDSRVLRRYVGGVVQTSRGCPYRCEFCSAITLNGRVVRNKPIPAVIAEVQQLYDMGFRVVWLTDENLAVQRDRARQLLQALRDWNRRHRHPMAFAASLSIDTARDDELLELAAAAGVLRVGVGVESVNAESLRETGKLQNLRGDPMEHIRRFHEHGILVQGGCMVGFDHDDLSIFREQYEFFTRAGVPNVFVYPLQALPGSRLKERVVKEGRYIDPNDPIQARWRSSPGPHVPSLTNTFTIIPRRMTIEQLQAGAYWLLGRFYDWRAVTERYRVFVEHYERSPLRRRLEIPPVPPDLSDMGIVLRTVRHILVGAGAEERRAFLEMFRIAGRSTHPQRFALAMSVYLSAKSVESSVRSERPDYASIPYPTPDMGGPSVGVPPS